MKAANIVTSDSIVLPEINSEYSDSDDEKKPVYDDWTHSPELAKTLAVQSTINPDKIFGAIRPLKMEEIFRSRKSKFRARTSSANWSGVDKLTLEEAREYEKKMGYQ
ncbi:hypothetical protein FISHEDRAFT_34724 [Fistulina hepatica ATCC 64428]|uniref:Inner centromere protein ARK-binding domain-containing protein n=1 Tax=Fistulina hepatica ATCC 64428 TaxID=1128425 RepID=A0A0D7AMC6_9AGAR|nr:hypothetical protein FISHEDRAFT_34724 [Fistulina hepatica ATCC 64428]